MENDILDNLWNSQNDKKPMLGATDILKKAKKQRRSQYIGIAVMTTTVLVLAVYAVYYFTTEWTNFNLGLLLMISSLVFRIILEFITIYRKENQLISMDSNSYRSYLKTYYKRRLLINYAITPLCFAIYGYGFYLLLPYFKQYLSEGFYNYIVTSGIISILVIIGIVVYNVIKEHNFLKQLQDKK